MVLPAMWGNVRSATSPLSPLSSSKVGCISYVTSALYSPAGALSSFTNGASIVSTYFYNPPPTLPYLGQEFRHSTGKLR
jgi:hypothetical protein